MFFLETGDREVEKDCHQEAEWREKAKRNYERTVRNTRAKGALQSAVPVKVTCCYSLFHIVIIHVFYLEEDFFLQLRVSPAMLMKTLSGRPKYTFKGEDSNTD